MRWMVSWPTALTISLAVAVFPGCVLAQGPLASPDGEELQQLERRASCEADATAANMTGDARKSVISTCLSRRAVGRENTSAAQEKLKWCNGQAGEKSLLDSARRDFIDNCVKGFVL